ncbi:hypothetical protein DFH07DRAFT_866378 [Mycena maculata]|uniref:Uncharacterized protein n=1 Tax=Mycena maculata TaxID=230809 RepID=A0AAD7JV86_9AGAR|nr:hypothetical protein DFH07DRAFT_866378 [Mycena maculata]
MNAFHLSLLAFAAVVPARPSALSRPAQVALQDNVKVRVPVQLGVMSRCPDALLCESVFDQVLQQVGSKIDISLVYVANFNSTDPEFGITCMHGPGECAGNVQQLCAAKYSTKWWEFVQCQNSRGRFQVGVPDLTLQCAQKVGIDWETSGVGSCAGLDASGKGTEGIELLQESVSLGKSLGLEKSCTVLINHKQMCVHDGEWDECEGNVDDFVGKINSEYELINGYSS